jgi:acetyl esterase/lipase
MRRTLVILHAPAWLAVLATTAWVWAASDRAFRRLEVPSAVGVRQDVRYRSAAGQHLSLDIYLPPSEAPASGRPAILAIHGGSWIGGSKRLFRPGPRDQHPTAVRLAESGYVVVAPDYRLARPGVAAWPAAREDLREAVRWIRRNARELEVDPGRIAAFGHSAGGHLAAVLGMPPDAGDDSCRVQAVVSFYGPSDLGRLPAQRVQPLAHEPVRLFLAGGADETAESVRDASPARQVRSETAPTLLIHGTRDPWVPIAQSEQFAESLRAAGVAHRLIRVEGARHGFELDVLDAGVPNPHLLPEILDFLRGVWNVPSG